MEISQEDRMKVLDEIAIAYGFVDRDNDEYTAVEIAERFGFDSGNVVRFLAKRNIKYTRRKAMADGRRVYVYRFNVIIEK